MAGDHVGEVGRTGDEADGFQVTARKSKNHKESACSEEGQINKDSTLMKSSLVKRKMEIPSKGEPVFLSSFTYCLYT